MPQRFAFRSIVVPATLGVVLVAAPAVVPAAVTAPASLAPALDVAAHAADTRAAQRRTDLRRSVELLRRHPDHPLFDTKVVDGTLYVEMIGRGTVPPDRIEALALRFRGSPANDVFTASVPVNRLDELLAVDSIEDLFFSTRLPR